MKTPAKAKKSNPKLNRPPAKTLEGEERRLISLAVDLASRQLAEGTASAQVITHFLKMGTKREVLEREILEKQKDLIVAKTEAMASVKQLEALTNAALAAMQNYTGNSSDDE